MKVDKFGPETECGDFLLSTTKNCEKLTRQTNRKPKERLEIKLAQPRGTLSFIPSNNLGVDFNWTIALTS